MALVFVSHASTDHPFVEEFVETILRNGCGLDTDEIFYSSAADMGVPDGADLMHHMREEVSDTSVVIAMLTPTYQSRPVCSAELGAAWARAGVLFPLLVPGMKRGELEGVLSAQMIQYMDEDGPLDRLNSKIEELVGTPRTKTATWTRAKNRWQSRLTELLAGDALARPRTVAPDEHDRVLTEKANLQNALAEAEQEVEKLRGQVERLLLLKDREPAQEIVGPTDSIERFEKLQTTALRALSKLRPALARVVVGSFSEAEGLPIPNDDGELLMLGELLDDGYIAMGEGSIEGQSVYVVRPGDGAVDRARDAVQAAVEAVPRGDERFDEWFEDRFDRAPHVGRLAVLFAVFVTR